MKTITRTVERDSPVITDGAVTVTMSTDQRDRYGDRISQDGTIDGQAFGRGLILHEYLANPIVQPFHEYNALPLGRAEKVWRDSITVAGRRVNRTRARIVFADESANPLAAQAFRLFRAGILRGVSIGFLPELPDAYNPADPGERERLDLGRGGRIFGTSTLWELSVAPLPANPGALSDKAAGEWRTFAHVARAAGHPDLAEMVTRSLGLGAQHRTFDLTARFREALRPRRQGETVAVITPAQARLLESPREAWLRVWRERFRRASVARIETGRSVVITREEAALVSAPPLVTAPIVRARARSAVDRFAERLRREVFRLR